MVRTSTLVCLVALIACGGSPTTEPAQPTTGGDRVEAGPPEDQVAAEDKEGDAKLETERRRIAEIPPPKGAPPAWLSMPMPAYQNGAVLKFAPAACEERVYVNVGGIVGGEAAQVRQVFDKFIVTQGRGDRTEYETVMRISKEDGVDPIAALREIAACEGKGPDVLVVGVATDKPLEMTLVFQKVMAALGDAPGQVERQGDISFLASPKGDEAVAQLGPNVLVFGGKDAVLAAARAKAGSGGFGDAARHLARAKTKDADLTVTEKGPNIEANAVIRVGEGKRAKELAAKISEDIKSTSDRLASTQLKLLGERLRTTKVAARGANVAITGSFARADLTALLKTANSADLEELMRSLKGR